MLKYGTRRSFFFFAHFSQFESGHFAFVQQEAQVCWPVITLENLQEFLSLELHSVTWQYSLSTPHLSYQCSVITSQRRSAAGSCLRKAEKNFKNMQLSASICSFLTECWYLMVGLQKIFTVFEHIEKVEVCFWMGLCLQACSKRSYTVTQKLFIPKGGFRIQTSAEKKN